MLLIAMPLAIEHLARQLLADVRDVSSSPKGVDQAIHACERFRVPLTTLAGISGFSSLLSRALALAKRRSPSLDELQVGAEGRLIIVKRGLQPVEAAKAAEAAPEGAVMLISELLALLVSLIGEPLTLSIVREQWPEVLSGSSLENPEEKHE